MSRTSQRSCLLFFVLQVPITHPLRVGFVYRDQIYASWLKALATELSNAKGKGKANESNPSLPPGGRAANISASSAESTALAFDTMLTLSSCVYDGFTPYLPKCLELATNCMQFYPHDSVRKSSALYVSFKLCYSFMLIALYTVSYPRLLSLHK